MKLVVAPYATALAAMIDPAASTANLRRLAAMGARGRVRILRRHRLHASRAPMPSRPTGPRPDGVVVPTYMAHHEGMTLVALANALLGRSHGRALPRRAARQGDRAAAAGARAPRRRRRLSLAARRDARGRARRIRARSAATVRRTRCSRTRSSSRTATTSRRSPTPAAATSVWRGLPVTRWRRDATRDAGRPVHLPARRAQRRRSGRPTYQPTRREPDDYRVTFSADRATFRRRDDDLSTQLDIAVSTEDDVEVRRLAVRNHGTRIREIDVTSYAEIVARAAGSRPRAPGVRQAVRRDRVPAEQRRAALPPPAARPDARSAAWAFHVLSLEGRPQGPVEWETDRARFLGRGRSPANPLALDGRALSGTTGVVLDPIVSLRQRIRVAPGGARCGSRSPPAWPSDRETAEALARKYHDPSAAGAHVRAGRDPRAERPAPPRHLGRRGRAVRAPRLARARHRRLAARRRRDDRRRTSSVRPACGRTPSPAICPILLVRVVGDDDVPLVRQVLQAQEYWRLKGLQRRRRDPQRASGQLPRRDAGAAHGVLDDGPWSTWQHRPGRRLPAARRPHGPRRARAARGRGARDPARRPRRPAHAARSARRHASAGDAAACRRRRRAATRRPTDGPAAAADAGERARRLHRRRAGLRHRPRRSGGDADAVGERHRQPAVRHDRHGVGCGAHLVGQQPREPADAVRERSGQRSDRARRSSSATTTPASRGRRRRADAPRPATGRLRRPPHRRPDALSRARRTASTTSSTSSSTPTIR